MLSEELLETWYDHCNGRLRKEKDLLVNYYKLNPNPNSWTQAQGSRGVWKLRHQQPSPPKKYKEKKVKKSKSVKKNVSINNRSNQEIKTFQESGEYSRKLRATTREAWTDNKTSNPKDIDPIDNYNSIFPYALDDLNFTIVRGLNRLETRDFLYRLGFEHYCDRVFDLNICGSQLLFADEIDLYHFGFSYRPDRLRLLEILQSIQKTKITHPFVVDTTRSNYVKKKKRVSSSSSLSSKKMIEMRRNSAAITIQRFWKRKHTSKFFVKTFEDTSFHEVALDHHKELYIEDFDSINKKDIAIDIRELSGNERDEADDYDDQKFESVSHSPSIKSDRYDDDFDVECDNNAINESLTSDNSNNNIKNTIIMTSDVHDEKDSNNSPIDCRYVDINHVNSVGDNSGIYSDDFDGANSCTNVDEEDEKCSNIGNDDIVSQIHHLNIDVENQDQHIDDAPVNQDPIVDDIDKRHQISSVDESIAICLESKNDCISVDPNVIDDKLLCSQSNSLGLDNDNNLIAANSNAFNDDNIKIVNKVVDDHERIDHEDVCLWDASERENDLYEDNEFENCHSGCENTLPLLHSDIENTEYRSYPTSNIEHETNVYFQEDGEIYPNDETAVSFPWSDNHCRVEEPSVMDRYVDTQAQSTLASESQVAPEQVEGCECTKMIENSPRCEESLYHTHQYNEDYSATLIDSDPDLPNLLEDYLQHSSELFNAALFSDSNHGHSASFEECCDILSEKIPHGNQDQCSHEQYEYECELQSPFPGNMTSNDSSDEKNGLNLVKGCQNEEIDINATSCCADPDQYHDDFVVEEDEEIHRPAISSSDDLICHSPSQYSQCGDIDHNDANDRYVDIHEAHEKPMESHESINVNDYYADIHEAHETPMESHESINVNDYYVDIHEAYETPIDSHESINVNDYYADIHEADEKPMESHESINVNDYYVDIHEAYDKPMESHESISGRMNHDQCETQELESSNYKEKVIDRINANETEKVIENQNETKTKTETDNYTDSEIINPSSSAKISQTSGTDNELSSTILSSESIIMPKISTDPIIMQPAIDETRKKVGFPTKFQKRLPRRQLPTKVSSQNQLPKSPSAIEVGSESLTSMPTRKFEESFSASSADDIFAAWTQITTAGKTVFYNKITKECRATPPTEPSQASDSQEWVPNTNEQAQSSYPPKKTPWLIYWDTNSQRHYFYHQKYGVTSWDLPDEIVNEARSHNPNATLDASIITQYIGDHLTVEWDCYLSLDREIYYYNRNTHESQWVSPIEC